MRTSDEQTRHSLISYHIVGSNMRKFPFVDHPEFYNSSNTKPRNKPTHGMARSTVFELGIKRTVCVPPGCVRARVGVRVCVCVCV